MDTQTNRVEWRPVPGFNYQVSNNGDVKRIHPHVSHPVINILKQQRNRGGYPVVVLSLGNKDEVVLKPVHALVALAFIGKRPTGFTIHHIDGNKNNNTPQNLTYLSSGDNTREAHARGVGQIGEKHNKAKLTEDEVRQIRQRYKKGTGKLLGAEFKVTGETITSIVRRDTWKHI